MACARHWATNIVIAISAALSLLAASSVAVQADDGQTGTVLTEKARPARIVSLNLCSDQLLMALADREQIASLSFFAADPRFSLITDKIGAIPLNHGLAEEVLALKPDLVLTGTYTTGYALHHIKAQNIPVVTLAPAINFAQIADRIMSIGIAVGQQDRAEQLVNDMQNALAQLDKAEPPATQLRVLSFASGGATVGAPSLFNAVVKRAGHINLAAQMGMGSWGQIGLEGIIMLRPDFVLLEGINQQHNSITKHLMQHRALRKMLESGTMSLANVDGRLWSCGGAHTIDAIKQFRELDHAR